MYFLYLTKPPRMFLPPSLLSASIKCLFPDWNVPKYSEENYSQLRLNVLLFKPHCMLRAAHPLCRSSRRSLHWRTWVVDFFVSRSFLCSSYTESVPICQTMMSNKNLIRNNRTCTEILLKLWHMITEGFCFVWRTVCMRVLLWNMFCFGLHVVSKEGEKRLSPFTQVCLNS